MNRFRNRAEAGRLLGERLRKRLESHEDTLILALPRGGVPVAAEVARILDTPLDLFLVRKLGVPGQEELAMGAIAEGGVRVMNDSVLSLIDVTNEEIERVTAREQRVLQKRAAQFRQGLPPPDVGDRTVVLIDDGVATGATMRAAAAALRSRNPAQLIVAVPVAAPETCEQFSREVDGIECLLTPAPFHAVGVWYDEFEQIPDDEVRRLLESHWEGGEPAHLSARTRTASGGER